VKAKQETGDRDDNETHRLDSMSGVTKGGGAERSCSGAQQARGRKATSTEISND